MLVYIFIAVAMVFGYLIVMGVVDFIRSLFRSKKPSRARGNAGTGAAMDDDLFDSPINDPLMNQRMGGAQFYDYGRVIDFDNGFD